MPSHPPLLDLRCYHVCYHARSSAAPVSQSGPLPVEPPTPMLTSVAPGRRGPFDDPVARRTSTTPTGPHKASPTRVRCTPCPNRSTIRSRSVAWTYDDVNAWAGPQRVTTCGFTWPDDIFGKRNPVGHTRPPGWNAPHRRASPVVSGTSIGRPHLPDLMFTAGQIAAALGPDDWPSAQTAIGDHSQRRTVCHPSPLKPHGSPLVHRCSTMARSGRRIGPNPATCPLISLATLAGRLVTDG
jgi:hypothetical protein